MKYSIHNVIVVPSEEDKVKLIGRSVFAGDNIPELILNAQTGINRKTLMEIVGGNKPFMCASPSESGGYSAIIVEKKYTPFDSYDAFRDAYAERIGASAVFLLKDKEREDPYTLIVTGWRDSGLIVAGCEYSWEELLKFYTFIDGSPVGVLEE